jgi:hypothetical protein
MSPFAETMVVDLDVVWFKSPSLLFRSPAFNATGSLFFRDRVNYRSSAANNDGVRPEILNKIFKDNKLLPDNDSSSSGTSSISGSNESLKTDQVGKNGISLYWKYGVDTADQGGVGAMVDFQESSVVLVDKRRLPKTIALLEEILAGFPVGYGDKEIYWIAATLSGESFAFEPYLPGQYKYPIYNFILFACLPAIFNFVEPLGQYGDCAGVIFHYDPSGIGLPDPQQADPFFCNAEYLVEKDITYVGEFLQREITLPIVVNAHTNYPAFQTWNTHRYSSDGCTCNVYSCNRNKTYIDARVSRYLALNQWMVLSFRKSLAFDSINVEVDMTEVKEEKDKVIEVMKADMDENKNGKEEEKKRGKDAHLATVAALYNYDCIKSKAAYLPVLWDVFVNDAFHPSLCHFSGCPSILWKPIDNSSTTVKLVNTTQWVNLSLPWDWTVQSELGGASFVCEPLAFDVVQVTKLNLSCLS